MRHLLTILLVGAPCLLVSHGLAAPPLIYEGELTTGDQPPDPWPGLRFAVVDAEGEVWWSTLVEPGGPHIEVGPDGRFVAYLEDSPENPWAVAGFDQGRWLRVDVCPGAWPANPADDCEWVRLEQSQRLGTVPVAETVSEAERARIAAVALEEAQRDIWVQPDEPGGVIATLRVNRSREPGTFETVTEALASIDRKFIPPGITVEIRIDWDPVPYEHAESVRIERPDGNRLQIIGEPAPDDGLRPVVLSFPESHGIGVAAGSQLQWLEGVVLEGRRDNEQRQHGVIVSVGSYAALASDVEIRDFSGHCLSVYGGWVQADGIVASGCGLRGIFATGHALVDVEDSTSLGNASGNFQARYGSVIIANGSFSAQGSGYEYDASSQAYIEAARSCRGEGAECDYRAGNNCAVYAGGANVRNTEADPAIGAVLIR